MSGAAASDSLARSSRFSAVAAMDDLDKYEVSALPQSSVFSGNMLLQGPVALTPCTS